ncbi:WG repeat-containing protein [Clostridium felsineum]|uniref:WG repeat-containing protein n=1 Tax=Clostridium felsineum TaxID=36839 RepID=UPI00098CB0ED|nr:WG repeat-containing protein [Clostridium felsineum]URZ17712.1 hypothetical protein CLFE_037670 [Clostridium felsineum DSM 794]
MMDGKFEINKLQEQLKRDPFEKYDEYEKRIRDIKAVNIAKGTLEEENYDDDYGFCYIKIEWYGINSVEKLKSEYFFCMISRKNLNGDVDFNEKYDISCKFIAVGEKVYIDNESLNISINGENYKIYCVNLYRQAFESNEEFKARITTIKHIPVGRIKFNKNNYDIKTSSIILNSEWSTIREVNVPKSYGLFAIINNVTIKEICERNVEYILYGKLMIIDKMISIDMGSLFIMFEDKPMEIFSVCLNDIDFYSKSKFEDNIKSISTISAGKVRLSPSKYDFEKLNFSVDVIWKKWASIFVSDLCSFSIKASKDDASILYKGGCVYDVYINFEVNEDGISVDSIETITFNKSIKLQYEIQSSEVVVSPIIDNGSSNDIDFGMGLNLMRYISDKGKYGYMDSSKRKILIEPKYDYIGSFYEGVARININDDWGFINLNGDMVIEPNFTMVKDFHEGLAAFSIKKFGVKKWGYVNLSGKIVIEAKYSEAGDFYNGIASVKLQGFFMSKKNIYISKTGKVVNYKKMLTAK